MGQQAQQIVVPYSTACHAADGKQAHRMPAAVFIAMQSSWQNGKYMAEYQLNSVRRYAVTVLILLAGCGLMRDPTGPHPLRTTQVILEPEAGWEGTVRVDSVQWLPIISDRGTDGYTDETEGTFIVWFANLSERQVQVRYELRFYDDDDFFLDHFFPFEQPLRLDPGERRRVNGMFRLGISLHDAIRLATMRLVVRPGAPASSARLNRASGRETADGATPVQAWQEASPVRSGQG